MRVENNLFFDMWQQVKPEIATQPLHFSCKLSVQEATFTLSCLSKEWLDEHPPEEIPRLVDVLPNGPRQHPTVRVFMAGGVPEVLEAGANIIGSCCGSTPDHTRAIRDVVADFNRRQKV